MDLFDEDIRIISSHIKNFIKYTYPNKSELQFGKLGSSSVRIIEFSDALFAGNTVLIFQMVCSFFALDKHYLALSMTHKSYKAQRVTLSVREAKVIAFRNITYVANYSQGTVETTPRS